MSDPLIDSDDDEPQCPAVSPRGNRCDLIASHTASHWHHDETVPLTDVWTDDDTE